MADNFNFDGMDPIDFNKIQMEEAAKTVATLYKAFRSEGLSAEEAVLITMSFLNQSNRPPDEHDE